LARQTHSKEPFSLATEAPTECARWGRYRQANPIEAAPFLCRTTVRLPLPCPRMQSRCHVAPGIGPLPQSSDPGLRDSKRRCGAREQVAVFRRPPRLFLDLESRRCRDRQGEWPRIHFKRGAPRHPPDSGQSDGARHRRPMADRPRGKRHNNQEVRSGGQGRNRTNDTRIFSTGERPWRRQKAEDREGVFRDPTEPPRPTEPIPNPAVRTSHRTGAEGHAGHGVAAGRTEPGPNRARSREFALCNRRA